MIIICIDVSIYTKNINIKYLKLISTYDQTIILKYTSTLTPISANYIVYYSEILVLSNVRGNEKKFETKFNKKFQNWLII